MDSELNAANLPLVTPTRKNGIKNSAKQRIIPDSDANGKQYAHIKNHHPFLYYKLFGLTPLKLLLTKGIPLH
jgi:hypothetical protein